VIFHAGLLRGIVAQGAMPFETLQLLQLIDEGPTAVATAAVALSRVDFVVLDALNDEHP
jgi:hypothetical protein